MQIVNSEYSESPINNPLVYPGKIPNFSFLLIGDEFHKLAIKPGRRIGQSQVIRKRDKTGLNQNRENLNNKLVKMGATSLEFRYPIVAYGSNGTPAQLHRKYLDHGISSIIPVVKAKITGLDVVYSPHISSYGAIPATVISALGCTISTHVTFVSQPQMEILDETEANYDRLMFLSKDYPLQLESGEILSEYYIYISRRGYLQLDNGIVPRLSAIPDENSENTNYSQTEIIKQILTYWNTSSPKSKSINHIEGYSQRIREDNELRKELSQHISNEFSGKSDDLVSQKHYPPKIYRNIKPTWPDQQADEYTIYPAYFKRNGDFNIVIHPDLAEKKGIKGFAVLTHNQNGKDFSVIGRTIKEGNKVGQREILVDQMLRTSLGVDIGDTVKISSISAPRRGLLKRIADWFFGKNYLIMRVQRSDLTLVEKEYCAMKNSTLPLLGVSEGDIVILESPKEESQPGKYSYEELRLRAFEINQSSLELREKNQSGISFQTRFPNCSEALGVYPDLPWIFLDADARKKLGISYCSPVRVRVSRKHQILKEFREFSIIVILAILGTISIFENFQISIFGEEIRADQLILLVGVLLVAWLTISAIRGRLSPKP